MGEVARKRGLGDQLDDLGRRVVHDLHGALQGAGHVEEGAVLATNIGGLRGPEESHHSGDREVDPSKSRC